MRAGRPRSRGARLFPAANPAPSRILQKALLFQANSFPLRALGGSILIDLGPTHILLTITSNPSTLARLKELALVFLKLGILGFGGPAAHIAMMEEEVVARRGWLPRERFLDLLGATNLIPGPNSTEMAIHLGYVRAGWSGLAVAGTCFILPAVGLTAGLAWIYVRFGQLPQVAPWLLGIKPAVLAIIAVSVWRLGNKACKTWSLGAIGAAVLAASLLQVNEVAVLLLGGVAGMLWLRLPRAVRSRRKKILPVVAGTWLGQWLTAKTPVLLAAAAGAAGAGAASASLWKLGLFFLKVGAVLYGSGYVLVAFLQGGLVHEYGWLTQRELLDAIAIGQFTPGPVLSTATFIGYMIAGAGGAAVATTAIFAPSFLFVALVNPWVPRLRKSPWTAAFLDAVNVSAVALMAAVTVKLGQATLTTWPAWLIAVAAVLIGLRWKINLAWVVVGGGALGWLLSLLTN